MSVVTTHHDTSQVEITISKRRYKIPPFGAYKRGTKGMLRKDDSRNIFKTLNQREHWLLWTLDQLKDPKTNIAKLVRAELSSEDARAVDHVYSSLKAKHILLRIKQNTYLLNPMILLPTFETYESVKEHWFSVGGKDPYE